MVPENAVENIPDRKRNGNSDGITVLIHSATPCAAPDTAVLLSSINASIPADAAIAVNHFRLSNVRHLGRIYAKEHCLIHMLSVRGETMSVKRKFNHFLPEKAIDPELFPIVPIVELAGSHRVLVENHLGVTHYSTEKIGIKMKYGQIEICGCGLTLEHMTRVKLIVTGRIDGICLLRGSGK